MPQKCVQESGLRKLLARNIDGDIQIREWPGVPLPQLLASGSDHPVTETNNETGLLGNGNKLRGPDPAALGMMPAQQRFYTNHGAAC